VHLLHKLLEVLRLAFKVLSNVRELKKMFAVQREVCNNPQVDQSSQQLRVTMQLPVGSTKWQ